MTGVEKVVTVQRHEGESSRTRTLTTTHGLCLKNFFRNNLSNESVDKEFGF